MRTTLEFRPGVTAIVGPNGAGKSNLSDAIRWAMGEQAPRLLRIRRAEDVIFGGSESRRRTGMADVRLTFDNAADWLPTEFDEVCDRAAAVPDGRVGVHDQWGAGAAAGRAGPDEVRAPRVTAGTQ